MNTKPTILEIYRNILTRAQDARAYWKSLEKGTEKDIAAERSDTLYWCAMMLEQTNEINPK